MIDKEKNVWRVDSAAEFEAFTPNPGVPLPKIVTTEEVAIAISSRGHAARFRTHAVEIVAPAAKVSAPPVGAKVAAK